MICVFSRPLPRAEHRPGSGAPGAQCVAPAVLPVPRDTDTLCACTEPRCCKNGALLNYPKARAICCIPEADCHGWEGDMGGWAASQAEGATQLFLQPKQLPASSLGKDHPQIRLQLEAPQSTALTPRGAASGTDFQSRHLSDFWAGGRGEGQMWLGDAKGKAVRQADLPGRSLGPEGASACFPPAH